MSYDVGNPSSQREDELEAENKQLKLDARTMQGEIERLKQRHVQEHEAINKMTRDQQVEINALKAQVTALTREVRQKSDMIAALTEAVTFLRAKVTALREALETHGRHSPACDIFMPPGTPCTCGLSA